MLYTHVQMTDPQSGLARDEWACSLALIPIMVIEGARCTRGVQAAVESTRNEIINRQDALNRMVAISQNAPPPPVIEAQTTPCLAKEEKNGR